MTKKKISRICKKAKEDFELKVLKANPIAIYECLEDLGISKASLNKVRSKKEISKITSKVKSCMKHKMLYWRRSWVRSVLKKCPSIKSPFTP